MAKIKDVEIDRDTAGAITQVRVVMEQTPGTKDVAFMCIDSTDDPILEGGPMVVLSAIEHARLLEAARLRPPIVFDGAKAPSCAWPFRAWSRTWQRKARITPV